jgi:hypothetical protein
MGKVRNIVHSVCSISTNNIVLTVYTV